VIAFLTVDPGTFAGTLAFSATCVRAGHDDLASGGSGLQRNALQNRGSLSGALQRRAALIWNRGEQGSPG
jgi:hypothetical protein